MAIQWKEICSVAPSYHWNACGPWTKHAQSSRTRPADAASRRGPEYAARAWTRSNASSAAATTAATGSTATTATAGSAATATAAATTATTIPTASSVSYHVFPSIPSIQSRSKSDMTVMNSADSFSSLPDNHR